MRSRFLATVVFSVLACAATVVAQEPPPRIPLFVIDVHANVPKFPDDPVLAQSRALQQTELPGAGLGGDFGVHLYPFKWRAITFGIGGQATIARAPQAPPENVQTSLRPVTERFASIAPQISFNFGTGAGWSYLSGGIATATWSIVAEGREKLAADDERLKTINYGGGARWFIKSRVAFSFDVRFYAINPGTPSGGLVGSPRTTFMIVGAGVSLR